MSQKERRRRPASQRNVEARNEVSLIAKANIVGFFSRHPKLMGDQGLLVNRNIDTTISVHFLCGFHIDIGNAYLSRSLRVEHPQRLTDDRKVLNFTPAAVAKINRRVMQHLVS